MSPMLYLFASSLVISFCFAFCWGVSPLSRLAKQATLDKKVVAQCPAGRMGETHSTIAEEKRRDRNREGEIERVESTLRYLIVYMLRYLSVYVDICG